MVLKMKSTRLRRFEITPGYAFVEPGVWTEVRLLCRPFNAHRLSERDRFTLLLAPVPYDPTTDPSMVPLSHTQSFL